MSIRPANRFLDYVTMILEDVAGRILPTSALRHPVQVEKAVLRAIDRDGTFVFLNEVYVCNVVVVLMNPADLEYSKAFPKTFREELLKSICRHVREIYGHAKNKDDVIELKIVEDAEVPPGRVDVEARFEETRSGVGR